MYRKVALAIAAAVCGLVVGAGANWWAITTGHLRPGGRVPVYVDGHLMKDHGLVLMGRTYLPVRSLAQSLGLSVETYADAEGIYLRSTRTAARATSSGTNAPPEQSRGKEEPDE